ncbi:leucine zipper putative tumor suppressor 2 homolog [Rhopalosiphum maidis]|uniref:leucine zipper putative tumor suppressor 2 homolog n=1 Tax=Rhopalosiphum maidis TaxID=43146 RepID=UPI000EFEBCB1|nr:leucine zipper putative tumor suppressor 2 homolog [Rhopalosiphum maidis]
MDSGNETLFSEDSSPDSAPPPSPSSGRGSQQPTPAPTPPHITSSLSKGNSVIRPVAFKPGSMRFTDNGERYGSTPILARSSHRHLYGSTNELHHQSKKANMISSGTLDRKLRSASPMVMSSLPAQTSCKFRLGQQDDFKSSSSYSSYRDYRPSSKSFARLSKRCSASEGSASLLDLTPSPSESTMLTEMETVLRDRDRELRHLRQTMEHNEQVIFRVYQEKENAWDRELRRIKAMGDNRLKTAAQKSLKLEQMLMMQTYKLQDEKKKLQEENERLESETTDLKKEVDELKVRLEETEWGLCQKSGELAHVKSQLKDTQSELTTKGHEVIALKSEVRDLLQKLESKERRINELEGRRLEGRNSDNSGDGNNCNNDQLAADKLCSLVGRLNEQVENELSKSNKLLSGCYSTEDLQSLLPKKDTEADSPLEKFGELERHTAKLIRVLNEERKNWDQERLKWFQEKEKVLCYQRQLQMNYVQMFRRTQAFEAQIENLTVQMNVCSDHCTSGKSTARKTAAATVKTVNAIKL